MKLITDAKRIWHRLWSVRLSLIASLLSAIEAGFSYFASGQPPIFAIVATLVSISAAVARVVSQDSLYADYEQAP